ncbi:hypothetical protein D3C83_39120 [compost metagenome]
MPGCIVVQGAQHREAAAQEAGDVAEKQPAVDFQAPVLDAFRGRVGLRVAQMRREPDLQRRQ